MQYFIYFVLICIIIGLIYFNRKKLIQQAKNFDELNELYKQNSINKYIEENKEKLDFEIRYSLRSLEEQRDQLAAEIAGKQLALEEISCRVKVYEEQLRNIALENAKRYEETLMSIAKDKVDTKTTEMIKIANEAHMQLMAQLGEQASQMREQIQTLSVEIEAYSAKQAAIGEAIMRYRAIEEQQDFYRVCLAPETASDVFI